MEDSDSIPDMFIGWIVILAGLMLLTDFVWMAGVYFAIFLPVLWSTKEKVTVQRLRGEELKPVTVNQSSIMIVGLILGLLLTTLIALVVFLLLQIFHIL